MVPFLGEGDRDDLSPLHALSSRARASVVRDSRPSRHLLHGSVALEIPSVLEEVRKKSELGEVRLLWLLDGCSQVSSGGQQVMIFPSSQIVHDFPLYGPQWELSFEAWEREAPQQTRHHRQSKAGFASMGLPWELTPHSLLALVLLRTTAKATGRHGRSALRVACEMLEIPPEARMLRSTTRDCDLTSKGGSEPERSTILVGYPW